MASPVRSALAAMPASTIALPAPSPTLPTAAEREPHATAPGRRFADVLQQRRAAPAAARVEPPATALTGTSDGDDDAPAGANLAAKAPAPMRAKARATAAPAPPRVAPKAPASPSSATESRPADDDAPADDGHGTAAAGVAASWPPARPDDAADTAKAATSTTTARRAAGAAPRDGAGNDARAATSAPGGAAVDDRRGGRDDTVASRIGAAGDDTVAARAAVAEATMASAPAEPTSPGTRPGRESAGVDGLGNAFAALGGGATVADAGSTPAAAASPYQLATPVDAPDFAASFGLQVSLLAQDGIERAELHLNPAEMGPVSIHIALAGDEARIDFGADRAATRHAIEQGLPELASALRDAGFTLAGGGVSEHAGARGGDGGGGSGTDRGTTTRGSAAVAIGGDVESPARVRALHRAAAGGVDLYA